MPENMSENVERLREVLLGDSGRALNEQSAPHLLKEGQDYLSELLSSEEAKISRQREPVQFSTCSKWKGLSC